MTPRKEIRMREDLGTVPSPHDPQRDRTVEELGTGESALRRQSEFMFSSCVTLSKYSNPFLICKMGQPFGMSCGNTAQKCTRIPYVCLHGCDYYYFLKKKFLAMLGIKTGVL